MKAIEKAHLDTLAIKIEKLSADTDTGCVCADVLKLIGKEDLLRNFNKPVESIGNNVWRAKIGKKGEWSYGRNIEEALAKAYDSF